MIQTVFVCKFPKKKYLRVSNKQSFFPSSNSYWCLEKLASKNSEFEDLWPNNPS